MSRSLNSYQKKKIKEAHNDTCDICRCKREKKYLQVHHIKKNKSHPKYNHDNNLMVLCNDYTDNKCHKDLHETLTSGERESEKKIVIKEEVDYQKASAEMQVNEYAEMPFRNFVKAKILKNPRKRYLKDESIYSGAEVCDISPTTSRKYLKKMTSEEGELEEYKDKDDKKKYVRFK